MPRKLPGRLVLATCAATLLLAVTGCPGRLRPVWTPVAILVSGPTNLEDIATHGSLARSRRAAGPCIWLACGDVFLDQRAAQLTRGGAQVRLLEAAGLDAVVLGPEWLQFGPARLAELVDGSRLQFLGANLADTSSRELGHPLYVSQVDGAAVGLTAVWTDSADVRLRQPDVELEPAGFAARKTLPLLKRRAEVVGIVVRPSGPVPGGNPDFAVGSDADGLPAVTVPTGPGLAKRLELVVLGDRIAEFRVHTSERVDVKLDAGLKATLDSLRSVVESLAARPVTRAEVTIPPRALANSLVVGCVGKDVDGFVYDRPLFVDSLPAGQVTVGALIDRLAEPGLPALVTLTGREIGELLAEDSVEAEWRRGVRMTRMPMNREFRVMTTTGFLARHRAAARRGFQLDQTSLWERAVEVLGRSGGQR